MGKFIATILLALFLSTATVSADDAEFDEDLEDFMPDIEKIMQEKKEYEAEMQRELIQKFIIGGAVLIVIFIGAKKLGNSRRFQVVKDYFYMLELTNKSKSNGNDEKAVVNELYAYCITREYLREIVEKHNASINDFEKIYKDLMTYCGAYKGKMFIPVSAFFFVGSLEYVLSHRIKSRAEGDKVARVLTDFFDKVSR